MASFISSKLNNQLNRRDPNKLFNQIKGVMGKRLAMESRDRMLGTRNTAASYQGNGTVTTLSGGTIKARLNTSAAIGTGETVQIDARAGSSETFIRTQPR